MSCRFFYPTDTLASVWRIQDMWWRRDSMNMKIKIALATALLYLLMAAPGLAVVVVKRLIW